jgi:hypothetical protein
MTSALTKADTYSKNIDLNQYIFNFNFVCWCLRQIP